MQSALALVPLHFFVHICLLFLCILSWTTTHVLYDQIKRQEEKNSIFFVLLVCLPNAHFILAPLIKYAHNTYHGSTRKIPSEDTFFYFQWRRWTAASMTANDGACWVHVHTFVIDDGVTSIGNALDSGSARLGKINFLIT